MNLSTNFLLKDFIKSDTAIRLGIDNSPLPEHLEALKALCINVLQPARNALGRIKVTSGYRSSALNKAVKGSTTSQHSKGQAADIECLDGPSNIELATWIYNNVDFDQLILEFYDGKDPTSGWVHVSYRADGKNRKSSLKTVPGTERNPQYVPWKP